MQYIYLIKSEETTRYKIGVSKHPKKRLKENQTGNSEQLTLVLCVECMYARKVENALHRLFSSKKINGEWFELSLEDELDFEQICRKIERNITVLKENNNFFI